MISAPKHTSSSWLSSPARTSPRTTAWKTQFRNSGNRVMNAAPRNAPITVPSPPMMTMKRIWNERWQVECLRLHRAEVGEGPERSRTRRSRTS